MILCLRTPINFLLSSPILAKTATTCLWFDSKVSVYTTSRRQTRILPIGIAVTIALSLFPTSWLGWTADLSDKKHLGSFLGFNRTMGDLGFVVGPIALGYLASSYSVNNISLLPFYFDSLVLIIIAIAIVFAKDPAANLNTKSKKN